MFNSVVEAETLQDVLESVTVLVEESKIHLEDDGIVIRAVDPANVGMVDLTLSAAAFESYEADSIVIGVDLERLDNFVDMADSGQMIHLDLDEEAQQLHLQADGLEYTVGLIDPESIRQEPDIPNLDLPADVVLERGDIDRAVRAADMISDHIELGVDAEEELFYVDAQGDTDDVHLELTGEDLIDVTPGTARSIFSLDYLKDMSQAIPSDSEVTVELGDEVPAKMHFTIADGQGDITFVLAPRVQNE